MAWRCASMYSLPLQVFLYSALCNINDSDKKPYPAARSPGEAPVSLQDSNAARIKAQAAILPQHEQPEVSSGGVSSSGPRVLRSGREYQRSAPLPFGMLHLTTRLASDVFLGGCVLLTITCLPNQGSEGLPAGLHAL